MKGAVEDSRPETIGAVWSEVGVWRCESAIPIAIVRRDVKAAPIVLLLPGHPWEAVAVAPRNTGYSGGKTAGNRGLPACKLCLLGGNSEN